MRFFDLLADKARVVCGVIKDALQKKERGSDHIDQISSVRPMAQQLA